MVLVGYIPLEHQSQQLIWVGVGKWGLVTSAQEEPQSPAGCRGAAEQAGTSSCHLDEAEKKGKNLKIKTKIKINNSRVFRTR